MPDVPTPTHPITVNPRAVFNGVQCTLCKHIFFVGVAVELTHLKYCPFCGKRVFRWNVCRAAKGTTYATGELL